MPTIGPYNCLCFRTVGEEAYSQLHGLCALGENRARQWPHGLTACSGARLRSASPADPEAAAPESAAPWIPQSSRIAPSVSGRS